ncbi:hypothetical protein ABZ926_20230 [Streptomyces litmocidini]|uniref:hypothetical protein n=1 Tax=Streptomyces litmocidini TaxID=67318 RepID=UPI0033FA62B5
MAQHPVAMGAASGTVVLVRTIGGSLGVAALGAVFTSRPAGAADPGLTPAQADALPAPLREAFRAAVTSGVHGVPLGTAVLAALAFAAAWYVRETPLRRPTEEAPAPAPRPPADRPRRRPS